VGQIDQDPFDYRIAILYPLTQDMRPPDLLFRIPLYSLRMKTHMCPNWKNIQDDWKNCIRLTRDARNCGERTIPPIHDVVDLCRCRDLCLDRHTVKNVDRHVAKSDSRLWTVMRSNPLDGKRKLRAG
jgi:hypothetical protein